MFLFYDFLWIFYRFFYGFFMDFLWFFYGSFMDLFMVFFLCFFSLLCWIRLRATNRCSLRCRTLNLIVQGLGFRPCNKHCYYNFCSGSSAIAISAVEVAALLASFTQQCYKQKQIESILEQLRLRLTTGNSRNTNNTHRTSRVVKSNAVQKVLCATKLLVTDLQCYLSPPTNACSKYFQTVIHGHKPQHMVRDIFWAKIIVTITGLV